MQVVGVISDTHGLLRPQAVAALRGVERIIHAGDIGSPELLTQLGRIAPVTAVRGNNDREVWAKTLPLSATLDILGHHIYVTHDVATLDIDPVKERFAAVITGHSHKPSVVERAGVLFLNPGSAGPRRFKLPVSLAVLKITTSRLRCELVELQPL